MACDKAGIKYMHGVECYLTEDLFFPPDQKEVQRQVMEELAQRHKSEEQLSERLLEEMIKADYQEEPDPYSFAEVDSEDDPDDYFVQRRFRELMESGRHKVRDNYHTILIAKNFKGLLELNELISLSSREDHFYYKPRITFSEFLKISNNVIKISACLASPLNKLPISHKMYERLLRHYDYLEIQPHKHPEQIMYNQHLAEMSAKYRIPLIAGTDTHSVHSYKAECRTILQLAKHIEFEEEDQFDLTYKTYDELVAMFAQQDALPPSLYMGAIENTNRMADSVQPFDLDVAFKYPILYGDQDGAVFRDTIQRNFKAKIAEGAITQEQIEPFEQAVKEELRVFDKIEMSGFMLFMSELATWCKENGIPLGFNRGSCGGSRVAYITNTTDLNPETWNTVFSRFCNEDRKELGDRWSPRTVMCVRTSW